MKFKRKNETANDVIKARGKSQRSNVRLTEDAYRKDKTEVPMDEMYQERAPIQRNLQIGMRYIDLLDPKIYKKWLIEFGLDKKLESEATLYSIFFDEETRSILRARKVKFKRQLSAKSNNEEHNKKRKRLMAKFYRENGLIRKRRKQQLRHETRIFRELVHKPSPIITLEKKMKEELDINGETYRFQCLSTLRDIYYEDWVKRGIKTELEFLLEEIRHHAPRKNEEDEEHRQSIFLRVMDGYIPGGESIPFEVTESNDVPFEQQLGEYDLTKNVRVRKKAIKTNAENYFKDIGRSARRKMRESTDLLQDINVCEEDQSNPEDFFATSMEIASHVHDELNIAELKIDISRAMKKGLKEYDLNSSQIIDFRQFYESKNLDDIKIRWKPGKLKKVATQGSTENVSIDQESIHEDEIETTEQRPTIIQNQVADVVLDGTLHKAVPVKKYSSVEESKQKKKKTA